MHLDDERVQRWIHGELSPEPGTAVREHLAQCAECRSLVSAAKVEEARIFDLLGTADHPAPVVSVRTILAGAGGDTRRWGRWAAAVLLGLVGAGAAYAAPGSPLPALVHRVVEWVGHAPTHPVVAHEAPVSPVPEAGAAAGIALAPGNRFAILFVRDQADGVATVSFTDSGEVVVRAQRGMAKFTSDVSRLSIDNTGDSARFDILVPRGSPWVEIHVRGRRIFLSQGSRVVTATAPDADGRYSLPLEFREP
jgi:Putative zinc-finger